MPRLKLHLAYVGTRFHGWQLQDGARTVQGCLEQALGRLVGEPVRVHGAGRTDAGVHALGQVAHADIPASRAHLPWQRAINALLPGDVAVTRASLENSDFHARFSAVQKTYRYSLWLNPDYVLPQRRPFVWQVGPLDQQAMLRAADFFVGRKDWSAFQNQGTPVRSTVRTITDVQCEDPAPTHELAWIFCADGFLKQMVRNIMGCMVAVGKGKLSVQEVEDIQRQGRRHLAPATAPACGLSLDHIEYAA
jgi:tRNA pseudouridine38-40 synthase